MCVTAASGSTAQNADPGRAAPEGRDGSDEDQDTIEGHDDRHDQAGRPRRDAGGGQRRRGAGEGMATVGTGSTVDAGERIDAAGDGADEEGRGGERARPGRPAANDAGRRGTGIVHDWTALALPASPRAAGAFRRHAVSAAHRWGLAADSGEVVEVCVSELVTNAIVHGVGRDVLMMLYYTGDSVLTEVFGHAVDEPAIPATARSNEAESGRGLLIVETLAKDWGSEHTGHGLLRVWASIAVFGGDGGRAPG
jgi:anti-sigma regulatory factor (Ser/Thr protein kinase)